MKRARTIAATMMAAVCLLALTSACDDDDPTTTATPPGTAVGEAPSEPEPTVAVSYAPAGPATFSVLAGATEGNADVEMFMPANMKVRVGDSIEWTAHGFEGHTITFGDGDDILFGIGDYLLPDPANPAQVIFNPTLALASVNQGPHDGTTAYINSGFIGVPVEAKYTLSFSKEGLFTYLCLVHPFSMTGTVTVEPEGTQVESPATVSARGDVERTRFLDELKAEARRLDAEERTASGPGDSTIHYVNVGAITDHGQAAVYTPGAIDIAVGDTVIFENDDRNFHNVIFKGDRAEYPSGIGIIPDPRGLNFSLDRASAVAVDPPPEGFDDQTFLSSGSLGVLQPRLNWTLKFDKPGTYVYACTIHVLAGMTGVINVQ